MSPVGQVLVAILLIAYLLLLARVVMSLIVGFSRWRPTGLAAAAFEAVYTVTDPPIKAIGRVLPPLRIGNARLDFSVLIMLVLINVLLLPLAARI